VISYAETALVLDDNIPIQCVLKSILILFWLADTHQYYHVSIYTRPSMIRQPRMLDFWSDWLTLGKQAWVLSVSWKHYRWRSWLRKSWVKSKKKVNLLRIHCFTFNCISSACLRNTLKNRFLSLYICIYWYIFRWWYMAILSSDSSTYRQWTISETQSYALHISHIAEREKNALDSTFHDSNTIDGPYIWWWKRWLLSPETLKKRTLLRHDLYFY
jgi:hypothetical protein